MGRYVNVTARLECVAQINELYGMAFPGEFLVYDRAQVEKLDSARVTLRRSF